jgi:hypothetical protein
MRVFPGQELTDIFSTDPIYWKHLTVNNALSAAGKTFDRQKITDLYLDGLVAQGIAITDPLTNSGLVDALLTLESRIILLDKSRVISGEELQEHVKRVDGKHYLNLFSAPTIRNVLNAALRKRKTTISFDEHGQVTQELIKELGLTPYKLLRYSPLNIDKPTLGFYWTGTDSKVRVVDWFTVVQGAELWALSQSGFDYQIVPRNFLGNNIIGAVQSRRTGEEYEVSLLRMPLFHTSSLDGEQYTTVFNFEASDRCMETHHKGQMHGSRAHSLFYICDHAAALYNFLMAAQPEAAKKGKPIKVIRTPFGFPAELFVEIADRLRYQVLIAPESGPVRPLNLTETNQILGMAIAAQGVEKMILPGEHDHAYFKHVPSYLLKI